MQNTTPVPNSVFDVHLPQLSDAELKIYLIVIRQTLGWHYKKTGRRKQRDRITHSQFVKKSGLSRRVISRTIQSLINRSLIIVTDYQFSKLLSPKLRKGKSYLYYEVIHKPMQMTVPTYAPNKPKPMHQTTYNKRKLSKETITKGKSVENCGLRSEYQRLRCKE